MNGRTLLYICALAVVVGWAPNLRAQSNNPPGDLPLTTSYRDYRLEGVVINPNSDPAGGSAATGSPEISAVPAAVAVPEPGTTALVFLGGGALLATIASRLRLARARK